MTGARFADIEQALGRRVVSARVVTGGDINDAFDVALEGGTRVFVKTNKTAPPRMFEAEADGLRFLEEGLGDNGGLVIPRVLFVSERFLVLEYLEQSARTDDEALGRGLARLHQSRVKTFGAPQANFIGTLGQLNEERATWVEFFREMRLSVQLSLPGARRLLSASMRARFDVLMRTLSDRLGADELPSRVHGDLWSGNYFFTERGPALFDPAAYGGHREVDLAMMRLFGGFSARTFATYQEALPVAPGFEERAKIYQLYPLLVHVNLFGSTYVGQVEDILRAVT